MARPSPIVIPGSMRTSQTTAPNLLEALQGLSLLAGLYQGTIGKSNQEQINTDAFKSLAQKLNLGMKPSSESPIAETRTQTPTVLAGEPGLGMGQDQGSFLVNLPQPSGLDLNLLAKSEPGRKIIANMAEKQYAGEVKPPEFGAIETAEGPVTYNKLTGQRGTLLGAPKVTSDQRKELANQAYGVAMNAQSGVDRLAAEKIMQDNDPAGVWKEYQTQMNSIAEGQGLAENARLSNVPGQESDLENLRNFLIGNNPKLGELATPETVTGKIENGKLVRLVHGTPGASVFKVQKNKLGQDIGMPEPTIDPNVAAQTRAETFGAIPTTTPGIYFDRIKKAYMTADGRKLTESEVRGAGLSYKEETPTNDIKVMKQSVPSVLGLTDQVEEAISKTEKNLGPTSSRWRDFASGKVGASDPDFRTLYSTTELLKSRLTKMHFGSKGGEKIVERFDKMIDASKDSPANLRATLEVIRDYANQVSDEPINQPKKGNAPAKTGVIKGAHGSY